jgi:hypothetical protein
MLATVAEQTRLCILEPSETPRDVSMETASRKADTRVRQEQTTSR